MMREVYWIFGQNNVKIKVMSISKSFSHLCFPPNLLPTLTPGNYLTIGCRHRSSVTLGNDMAQRGISVTLSF